MPRRSLASLAAPLLVLGLAACGGDEPGAGQGGADQAAPPMQQQGDDNGGAAGGGSESAAKATDTVKIADFKFKPPTFRLNAGTKITFDNVDTAGHTATAEDDAAFDTGSIPKGKAKTVTVKKAGTIPYICDFHPFMKGTVVVE